MSRVLTAAAFVRHNMPLGTTFKTPVISDDDAYDVAAYINSLERPAKANLEMDLPNEFQKPVDAPYGPHVDRLLPGAAQVRPIRSDPQQDERTHRAEEIGPNWTAQPPAQ